MSDSRLTIVKRAVKEIQNGMNVNLGIGMPTLIANEIPEEYNVMLQSENGSAWNWTLSICRRRRS